ncbi:MAG: tRNA pseudouridine(38-40) synthase TruA [Chloroflexi bacterium]|nr:tRNA pseudouridine(38-40) synthase TruA [Chloroflexota bacterium]
MAPYQLTIAYDGTEFFGFQRQKNRRTVQDELERALREIGWQERSILSAGRTDTGVHAEGQVIAFKLDWVHCPDELVKALNSRLPLDVSVRTARITSGNFHPRYDATTRRYRYQIVFLPERNPILERYHWRVWPEPDHEMLMAASEIILGEHDFAEFGKPPKEEVSTIRSIFCADWEFFEDGGAHFLISSRAFLYHMVRRIVFLLVRVGQGKVEAIELEKSFKKTGKLPPGIAPAHGLFLEEVNY